MGEGGLSSSEALGSLHLSLNETVKECKERRSQCGWVRDAWWPGSQRSLFRVTSLLYSILLILALTASTSHLPGLGSALVMLVLSLASLVLSGWESYQRSVEVFKRAEKIVEMVRRSAAGEDPAWLESQYPSLDTPPSPSLLLQRTLRDGQTLNLPWALLVSGDLVLLRPGDSAPASCHSPDSGLALEKGQLFHPDDLSEDNNAAETFVLDETPYLAELRRILSVDSEAKPLSRLTKQRQFLVTSLLEYICTPVVLVLVLAWNCVRHMYSWSWLSGHPMSSLFLTEPITAVIPLLPLMFPLWWVLVNTAALSNVLTIFRQAKTSSTISSSDPFDDTVEPPDLEQPGTAVPFNRTINTFYSCLLGRGEHLCRTENILHSLGSVTSFCCTDKKGVLSWPNKSPEKLFFLRRTEAEAETEGGEESVVPSQVVPEILTISQDHNNPFQVQFDDPNWRRHLASLKPLGLSVLLNTCNSHTEQKYRDFYNYLLCQSTSGPLPPARGCLCQLSNKIGIREETVSADFTILHQVQSFRPAAPETQDPADTKKFPLPHQVSVVAREVKDGRMSLLSQGTGDLVLDSCVDVWTGDDLTPLTAAVRKKCSEFYQRASLTSYCTSYSYKPLLNTPDLDAFQHQYLQLPSSLPSYAKQQMFDTVSIGSLDDNMLRTCSDVIATLQSQSFLGMVQLQYQAMVDMVQFIDLLEKACIRFVHFSKENELRSRVFSEKMGLESGWNCHISLQSKTDLERAESLMYGRRGRGRGRGRKGKFPLSSSLPTKLESPAPAWCESWQPLVSDSDSEDGSIVQGNNRAQLPAGIENIRPHLDKMDNVPLLVSLFTDCNSDTTAEMVEILQENGEVVIVMGSAANHHNMRIFLRADASISVEPVYPQACRRGGVMTNTGPTELARTMISLGTSVSFRREEDVSIYRAIIRSRRHVLAIRHGLELWVSSCLFLCCLVSSCSLLLLPCPLTPPQMLVLSSLYLPALCTAAFYSSYDGNISNISTGKNIPMVFSSSSLWYCLWCYALRFVLAYLALLLSHLLSILHLGAGCEDQDQSCYDHISADLSLMTDTNMTATTLYLLCISLSFLSRTDHLCQLKFRRSSHILITALVIVLLQTGYFAWKCFFSPMFSVVPLASWILLSSCLPVQLLVNELIKRHEIKVNVRFQKRARLDFNTKLGINSPF